MSRRGAWGAKITHSAVGFAIAHWALSRLLILIAIWLVAPVLPIPAGGVVVPRDWQALIRWDSQFYLQIAETGYEYADDGKAYNIAFFPALPLLIRAGMLLGLPPEAAGLLANNLAFLAALILLYHWVNERHGQQAARWAAIALVWCPFSLFGTVLYTEGVFLLVSTAALASFDRKQYGWAAVWGALASATRLPGLMLVPAFLFVSWKEQRGLPAYLCSLAAGTGALFYSLFCWLQFSELLAFLKVQKAWHPHELAYGQAWLKSLVQITLGSATWKSGKILDPLYPIAVLAICAITCLIWRFRQQLGKVRTRWGFCVLALLLWILAGSPLVNVVMVLGSAYLAWHFRRELRPVAAAYGLLSVALILGTGRTISAERYMYAVVPVAIAFGILLSRYPRWGYPICSFFALLLFSLAIRFSQQLWAG
ncbi:MAG: hypothetical protein HC866_06530 [Leptolyngbyaceae cyanobacterium RU_5_1]|nr:hypothetical protein [Leptolyngbyaceae cyanobacterium RU_5_1]